MSRPILLLGSQGQVGWEARRALSVLGPVVPVSRAQCDLGDLVKVRALVRDTAPWAIVNAAAYTAVDAAESDEATALRINAELPEVLAEEANTLGAWLLHYSTDYVFDGTKASPYEEGDATGPLGAYGRTKLAGETCAVRAARHLVFRTSWVFGAHGGNFLKTMLRLGRERAALKVVADQFGAPTSAALIADVTAHALRRARGDDTVFGLYHLASHGETSWHGYARHVMATAAQLGENMACRPESVAAIPASEYPVPAPRPSNSRLDTGKLERTFGLSMPSWQEQVEHVLATILRKNA